VKADLVRTGRLLAPTTLVAGLVVVFLPGHAVLALRIYVLVLCAAALLVAVSALRRAFPAARPLRPAHRAGDANRRRPPGTLARLEQEVALGIAGSFDLHHRLRPRLRGLAGELLHLRRGISLGAQPDAAHGILGDETWELVRPDRPAPEDRLARGVPPPELLRVVESLERL